MLKWLYLSNFQACFITALFLHILINSLWKCSSVEEPWLPFNAGLVNEMLEEHNTA